MKYTIGIDLGGTHTRTALLNPKGTLIEIIKKPTPIKTFSCSKKSVEFVISNIHQSILDLIKNHSLKQNQILGIGLASAGPLNVNTGTLLYPANFHGWKIVPIVSLLKTQLKKSQINRPLFFQNDAMAAALGEGWLGATQNLSTYALITIGTGIGTGVVFNSKPAQSNGMGSEWGHIAIDFHSLKNPAELFDSTTEGIASGTALLKRAKKIGFTGSSTEELVKQTRSGDQKYQIIFDDMARSLALLCYNLSMGFNLEKIAFGGGMIECRDLYFSQLKSYYNQFITLRGKQFRCPLILARLGPHAGVIGAARLPLLK